MKGAKEVSSGRLREYSSPRDTALVSRTNTINNDKSSICLCSLTAFRACYLNAYLNSNNINGVAQILVLVVRRY